MIRQVAKLLIVASVAITVAACGDTWRGAKKDTGENLRKTGEAIEKAGEAIQK